MERTVIRTGLFVEFFGLEVFIPLNELSYQRWRDAAEHFRTGETIVVKVLSLDRTNLADIRIELSVKQTGKNPFDDTFGRYKRGNRYIGTTSMNIPAGVIVALDGDVDCLCRFPERGRPPMGSRVAVKILGVNVEQKRIWGAIVHVSP